ARDGSNIDLINVSSTSNKELAEIESELTISTHNVTLDASKLFSKKHIPHSQELLQYYDKSKSEAQALTIARWNSMSQANLASTALALPAQAASTELANKQQGGKLIQASTVGALPAKQDFAEEKNVVCSVQATRDEDILTASRTGFGNILYL